MCNNRCNGNCHHILTDCDKCNEPCDKGCPVKDLTSDCVIYNGDDILCGEVVVVPKNITVTFALTLIVSWVCNRFSQLSTYFTLKNVGTGSNIYKGISLIGERELRSLKSNTSAITITQEENEIQFGFIPPTPCVVSSDQTVKITETKDGCADLSVRDYVCENVGEGEGVFKEQQWGTFRFKSLTSNDNSVDLLSTTDEIDFKINNLQKTIDTFPYTLTSADDKYTIFLENGVSDVTILVPNGLVSNFSCIFIQKGTSEVRLSETGSANLFYPTTYLQNKIKGQYFWAMVEKDSSTENYYLLGSLKSV